MSTEAALPPPLTLEQMKQRLTAIEVEVQSLREAIDFEERAVALKDAMASIDRGEGRPGREALASLRAELGLPARGATGSTGATT